MIICDKCRRTIQEPVNKNTFHLSDYEPTPEEIEERNAASKKWRDEHKEIYNARMRAYRKKQKEQKQAKDP